MTSPSQYPGYIKTKNESDFSCANRGPPSQPGCEDVFDIQIDHGVAVVANAAQTRPSPARHMRAGRFCRLAADYRSGEAVLGVMKVSV